MKQVKQIFFFIFLVGFSIPAFSQTAIAVNKTGINGEAKADMKPMKKHVCTGACKKNSHVYIHGEKGHICTEACRKANTVAAELKEHVCTDACEKTGKHVYAHGEKGHVCTDACEKDSKSKM